MTELIAAFRNFAKAHKHIPSHPFVNNVPCTKHTNTGIVTNHEFQLFQLEAVLQFEINLPLSVVNTSVGT